MNALRHGIVIAVAVGLLFPVAGCGSKSKKKKKKKSAAKVTTPTKTPDPPDVVKIKAPAKAMCACEDKPCAVTKREEFTAFVKVNKATNATQDAHTEASNKLMKCYMALAKGATPPAKPDKTAPTKKPVPANGKGKPVKMSPTNRAITDSLASMKSIADFACKCKGVTCRRDVSRKIITWRNQFKKTPPGANARPTLTALQKRIQKCLAEATK